MFAIETKNLTKYYGKTKGIENKDKSKEKAIPKIINSLLAVKKLFLTCKKFFFARFSAVILESAAGKPEIAKR